MRWWDGSAWSPQIQLAPSGGAAAVAPRGVRLRRPDEPLTYSLPPITNSRYDGVPQADQLRALMARWQDAEGDVCVPGEIVTALEAVTQAQRRGASATVFQRVAGRAAAASLAYAVEAPGSAGWPPAGDEAWRSASSHGSEGPSPTAAPQSTVAVPYVGYEDDQPRSTPYRAAGRGRRGDSGWRIRRRKPHSPVSEIARGCVAMAVAGLYAVYGGVDGAFSAVVLVFIAAFGLAVVIRGVRRLVR